MPQDYYDILSVARTASADQIKKAYRRLAKQYHPDVNEDPGAKERFQEVQEAYDVLSDDMKRKQYDQFGHAGIHAGMGADGAGGPFGGFNGQSRGGPGGFNFNFADEGGGISDVFEQFFGGGGDPFGQQDPAAAGRRAGRHRAHRAMPGQNLTETVTIPFDLAARGGTYTITLQGPAQRETIDVKIPRGVSGGAKLRVRDKGQPSPTGGARGDLILTIAVHPHPYFRREGLDLSIDLPISIDEAVFGATIAVPSLDGVVDVKIPAGASGGRRLRLKEMGVQNENGAKGDLYVVLRIDVPDELDDTTRQTLEQLRGKLPDPRRDMKW